MKTKLGLGPHRRQRLGGHQDDKPWRQPLTRQLIITLVDEKGPAAGCLKRGDVILGIDGRNDGGTRHPPQRRALIS